MQAKLIVVGGKASKREVLITTPAMLGRSREAGLSVSHPMISRKHCEVREVDGLLVVHDLGSLNGTYVGGRRVREAPLPPGAKFSMGPLTFRVEYDYAGDLNSLPPVVPDTDQAAELLIQETAKSNHAPPPAKAAEPAPAAQPQPAAPVPPSPAPPPDAPLDIPEDDEEELDELDFQVVDEDDEDSEPARPSDPPSDPKPPVAEDNAALDPEEQALNDFLKGLD